MATTLDKSMGVETSYDDSTKLTVDEDASPKTDSVSQHTAENENIEPSSQEPVSDQAQQIDQSAFSSNLPRPQKSKKKNVDFNNQQRANELLELVTAHDFDNLPLLMIILLQLGQPYRDNVRHP